MRLQVVLALHPTPEELQVRARAGDVAAFGQVIRGLDHDLRGVAWSVVRSDVMTDDVMQSAYEKAFKSIRSFDGRSSMKTWLSSIIYRTAIDHTRRERLRTHSDIAEAESLTSGNDATADSAIDRTELDRLLLLLDPDQRVAVVLTSGLGFSFDEAADITGEARGTIASRVARARKKLNLGEKP